MRFVRRGRNQEGTLETRIVRRGKLGGVGGPIRGSDTYPYGPTLLGAVGHIQGQSWHEPCIESRESVEFATPPSTESKEFQEFMETFS